MVVMLVTGCSSVETRNGREGMEYNMPGRIHVTPLQAEVKVGQMISGVGECERWFWFWTKQPAKQTYGISSLQVDAGNFSKGPCTRGALYDALSKNSADIIIAPRYTAVKKGSWCIFGLCAHAVNQIIVTGYKGNVVNFQKIEQDKVEITPNTEKKKGFRIFGLKLL